MDTFNVSGRTTQPTKTPASAQQGQPDAQGQSLTQDEQYPVLDLNQTATLLQCHPKTVRRLAQSGVIPGFRLGKLWRFSRAAIYQWIEAQGYNQRTVRAA